MWCGVSESAFVDYTSSRFESNCLLSCPLLFPSKVIVSSHLSVCRFRIRNCLMFFRTAIFFPWVSSLTHVGVLERFRSYCLPIGGNEAGIIRLLVMSERMKSLFM